MKFDLSGLDKAINQLDNLHTEADQSLSDTLNFAGEMAIDNSIEMITNELDLSPTYVASKISISKRATVNDQSTTVSAERRGVLMPRYDTKQLPNRGGVSVKIKKNGPRKTMKSAFFLKLKRGNQRGEGAMAVAYRPKDGVALNPRHQPEINRRGYAVMHSVSVSQALETMSEQIPLDENKLINFFLNRVNRNVK